MFGISLVSVVARHKLDPDMAERFIDNVELAMKLLRELDGETMSKPPPPKVHLSFNIFVLFVFCFFNFNIVLGFNRIPTPRIPGGLLSDPTG